MPRQYSGIEKERELSRFKGLNEFLSCLVFIKKLEPVISAQELIRGISCIEATIPFRKTDSAGVSPADRLGNRIRLATSKVSEVQFSDEDLATTVSECRKIGEKDLASFGSEDTAVYLSNTWSVIFENYPSLRNPYFSVSEYKNALWGTFNFLNSLEPACLYWVDGSNLNLGQKKLLKNAKENLELGNRYLIAQICAVALIDAIALQTGGDAPWELFLGQARKSREHDLTDLEKLLKKLHPKGRKKDAVCRLLENGREFDLDSTGRMHPLLHFCI